MRVDFVYEPGQYSAWGIIDIFSFSNSEPYRIDLFGREVDSIRSFAISSQLSNERLQSVEIIPNFNKEGGASARVSFAEFVGSGACYWF